MIVETPKDLPLPLAELEAQIPSRSEELRDAARCIGCMLARSEHSGEEIPVNTPAIATCTGRSTAGQDRDKIYKEVRRFEEKGLVEAYVPEKPPTPNRGNWQPRRTHYFRVTDTGREAFPAPAENVCNLTTP